MVKCPHCGGEILSVIERTVQVNGMNVVLIGHFDCRNVIDAANAN